MGTSDSFFGRTFRELKRRRVFRVAAAYGLLAWILVEVSSIVAPAFFLPDWTERLVIYLVLLGFPVAMFLAWAYDVTPGGVVRTGPATREELKAAATSSRSVDYVVIAVLLAVIGYQFYLPGTDDRLASEFGSIAVLPFVDLTEFSDAEYFSEGMSEELLNSLSRVDGLRVAARTSSFAFKGTNADIRSIGRELNVDTVLEGSVRKSGDRVRITAQLISVDDGFHLWSGTFDRKMDDIFEIQNDIAGEIVRALQPEFGGGKEMAIAQAPTTDIRAYDLYLLGRHNWHQRTPESLERALDLFQQAVAIDQEFALAYTGLADTYLLLEGYAGLDHEEALQGAEPAVASALALDDTLAEAYASLGLLRLNSGDLTAAELALRKSISLNSKYSMAHMWLGLVLKKDAGLRDAYREFDLAHKLDPLHPVVNSNLADALGNMGRYEEAAARINKIVEQNPESANGYFAMAKLAFQYGHFDQAIDHSRRAQEFSDYKPYARGFESMSYAALGDFARARELADQLVSESPGDLEIANMISYAYFMMGEIDALAEVTEGYLATIDDWQTAELDEHDRFALIWPGVTRVMQGRYEEGAAMLERVLLEAELGADPAEFSFLLSCLAYAYEESGRQPEADALWQQIQAKLAAADDDGWARPDFAAARAVVYLAQGRDAEAFSELSDAVAAGWRHYWLAVNWPAFSDHMDSPEMQSILNRIQSDLAAMRGRVREASATMPTATTVKTQQHSSGS